MPAKADSTEVVLWVALLIAAALAGGLLILLVRKRMLSRDHQTGTEGMLQSLRTMRDTGAMTGEEYDAARKAMIDRIARITGPPAVTGHAPGARPSGSGAPPRGKDPEQPVG